MKRLTLTVVAISAAVSSSWVSAACDRGYYVDVLTGLTLLGQTVTASGGGDSWVEAHCTGGALWKVGSDDPNDKVDGPTQVGTWSANLTTVTYVYSPVNTFVWDLFIKPLTNEICWEKVSGPGTIDTVTGTFAANGSNVCK